MANEFKIRVLKKPNELKDADLHKIFKCAFSNIPDFVLQDLMSRTQSDGRNEYKQFFCNQTGYSINIYDNYDILIDSDMHPIKKIPLLSIINCLIEIGAVNLFMHIDCDNNGK